MHDPQETDRLLTTAQAADYLGIRPQTLRKWRLKGGGPVYVRLGARRGAGRGGSARAAYRASDVAAWIEARRFASTSAEKVSAVARSG